MNIEPRTGYILVKKVKKKTNNSVALPDELQEETGKLEVVAINNILNLTTENIKVGNIIYINNFIGVPIKNGKETYFFVKEEDVLGKEK